MRKLLLFSVFFNCIILNGFSDNTIRAGFYYDTDRNIEINIIESNRIKMYKIWSSWHPFQDLVDREGYFNIVSEYDITFIDIYWDNKTNDKYLLLFYADKNYFILYTNDSEPFFIGKRSNIAWGAIEREYAGGTMFASPEKISATSFLIENDVIYSPDNILNLSIGQPWVEGVTGHGIGEKIILSGNFSQTYGLYISIGFVSFNRPYLYGFNSRPSRVRVSYENYFFIVNLNDTPHFQTLIVPNQWNNAEISETTLPRGILEIEILNIYPGTRWADTCINTIRMDFFQ
jgi:hypothetical protein